jgi:fatty acid desaturase
MIRSIQLGYSYILTLILALPAAAFLVRIFILFHDCVHDSFFMSKGANTLFGYLLALLLKIGASATFGTTGLTRISMRGDSAASGP